MKLDYYLSKKEFLDGLVYSSETLQVLHWELFTIFTSLKFVKNIFLAPSFFAQPVLECLNASI